MQDFRKKVKKRCRSILFFLLLLLLLSGTSKGITELSKRDDNLIQSRNKSIIKIQKEPEDTIDVLFLGDSLAYTSFSPMQMWSDHGFTSFVGSQAGQKIQESYSMLRTALEKQNPKVVVLETNVLFREMKGFDGIRDVLAEKGTYYFPVFRFHDIWKPLLMGTQYKEENFKGFMIRDIVSPYEGKDYMQENKEKHPISDLVQEYLQEIRNLCSEHGASLLLVSTPSPVNYNYKKYNALKEYGQENQLAYVDLNLKAEELGIDWKLDSLDKGDHLNLTGAMKVTAYIGNYLKNHYPLTDHREDSRYSAWEKEASQYREKAEKKMEVMKKK